jgi:ADP-heptose:LPS heptosyltransferase
VKILISSYTALGNFILKTPLIRAINKEYETCQIDLIFGYPRGAENILKDSGLINKQYWLSSQFSIIKKIKMFEKLRQQKYDLIILPFDATPSFVLILSILFLHNSKIISHLPSFQSSSIKERLKILLGLLFIPSVEWVSTLKGRHEIDLNLDLLQAVTKNNVSRDYSTIVNWKNENITHFNLPESFVAIQPSAANGAPTPKTWNPENFNSLIDQFLLKFPEMGIVLLGDSGDIDKLKGLHVLSNNNAINLLGKTNFNQLCNVLNSAQAVITHDSGIMHVANALKVPLIALYGPTDYTRTAPLASSTRVLHSRTDCWRKMYGFQGSERQIEKQYPNYYCMSGITVNQVMKALQILLKYKV